MKRLITVRHGNTFSPGQTPTRVGRRTDLPLVEEERGRKAGRFLQQNGFIPDRVYAAPLLRTMGTARLILDEMALGREIFPAGDFLEIDYGPDENKTEEAVCLRLGRLSFEQDPCGVMQPPQESDCIERGKSVIDLWNAQAVPPPGWCVDVDAILAAWAKFADAIAEGETHLVVSSNGIIRFLPQALLREGLPLFLASNSLKVATGGICVFVEEGGKWEPVYWNSRPCFGDSHA